MAPRLLKLEHSNETSVDQYPAKECNKSITPVSLLKPKWTNSKLYASRTLTCVSCVYDKDINHKCFLVRMRIAHLHRYEHDARRCPGTFTMQLDLAALFSQHANSTLTDLN